MRVITWQHKYGTDIFDASDEEALQESAREIIRRLIEMQYIYKPDDEVDFRYSNIDMELAELTDEQVDALPTQSLKDEASKHKKRYRAKIREHEESVEDYRTAVRLAAGEEIWERGYGRSSYNDPERYDAFVKKNKDNPEFRMHDDYYERLYKPWLLVKERNGGEYEIFDTQTVWTHKEEKQ